MSARVGSVWKKFRESSGVLVGCTVYIWSNRERFISVLPD